MSLTLFSFTSSGLVVGARYKQYKCPHHDRPVVPLCPQRGLVWSQLLVLSVQELCII